MSVSVQVSFLNIFFCLLYKHIEKLLVNYLAYTSIALSKDLGELLQIREIFTAAAVWVFWEVLP